MLLRAILYTRRGPITTESNDSAARAATALYHRLCTWPLIGIGFQMMFLPAATWTRAVGLRGPLSDNGRGLGSLTDFNYFIIVSVLSSISHLVKQMG